MPRMLTFSVRHDCLEPLGLTMTEAAEALGATRHTLNNLVNGKSGISADMAIRLDEAFGGGTECGYGCKWRATSASPSARSRHQRQAGVPP